MKKVFVHFADGFEEVEAITPVDVLRRAGCEVTMVSVTGNKQVKSSRGIVVTADKLFNEVDYNSADMIVIPGGMPGAKNLDEHQGLKNKVLQFNNDGKWLAAICAGPIVLGHLGLLKNKTVTCFPGYEEDLLGANCTGKPVEVDGKIITGRGAGVALKFSLALVEALIDKNKANEVKEKMVAE
jgi:4-methyl-5(b-hydroxyethyl)-thiazole monophosphate biosynthesis